LFDMAVVEVKTEGDRAVVLIGDMQHERRGTLRLGMAGIYRGHPWKNSSR
jgi:hypothetical protein